MKRAGVISKIDRLGRILIPKPLRTKYNLNENDKIEFYIEPDALVMKKFEESCIFCGSTDDLTEFRDQTVCKRCLNELRSAE